MSKKYELISKKSVQAIVENAGYDNGIMDYKQWSDRQFKMFTTDTLYRTLNSIDKEVLRNLVNPEN